jgi:hypothetical protein
MTRLIFGCVIVLVMAFGSAAGAEKGESVGKVKLQYGKDVTLKQEAAEMLRAKAIELLETSNFNSRAPGWEWDLAKIQASYRKAVAGNYLLVTFEEAQTIKTVRGDVSVREIVIALNRSDYADSLLTVDNENRVVGHSKYSGPLCVKLLEVVKGVVRE